MISTVKSTMTSAANYSNSATARPDNRAPLPWRALGLEVLLVEDDEADAYLIGAFWRRTTGSGKSC